MKSIRVRDAVIFAVFFLERGKMTRSIKMLDFNRLSIM